MDDLEQDILKLAARRARPQDDVVRALAFCVDTLRRVEWLGSVSSGGEYVQSCPDCGGTKPRHSQECYVEAALEIAAEAVAS